MDSLRGSGGLALMWRKDVDVDLSSLLIHHIDVVVKRGLGEEEWRCT